MAWLAALLIGMILGAAIMSVGIAIGRRLGEVEAIRYTEFYDDEGGFENEIGGY